MTFEDMMNAEFQAELMWKRVSLYSTRVKNTERRIKRFGIKRLFFWRFFDIHEKLNQYRFLRNTYFDLAILLTSKVRWEQRYYLHQKYNH